jgi:hypothetical protein
MVADFVLKISILALASKISILNLAKSDAAHT